MKNVFILFIYFNLLTCFDTVWATVRFHGWWWARCLPQTLRALQRRWQSNSTGFQVILLNISFFFLKIPLKMEYRLNWVVSFWHSVHHHKILRTDDCGSGWQRYILDIRCYYGNRYSLWCNRFIWNKRQEQHRNPNEIGWRQMSECICLDCNFNHITSIQFNSVVHVRFKEIICVKHYC